MPGIRGRSRIRSRSFSVAIPGGQVRICWSSRSPSRVSMIFVNWSGWRCSRFLSSRFLTPYSGSPDRPRRPCFSWMARRRTSLSIVVASCTTWKTSTARVACGSIRRTAEASTGHLSITAICTPWHQIGPAWGSQEAPVIGGAARELAPQARGTADIDKPGMPPVGEPGVPPVGEHHPGVGVGIAGEPRGGRVMPTV